MKKQILKFGFNARSLLPLGLSIVAAFSALQTTAAPAPKVEVVAELPIRPGNVAATADGKVFATVHPFDKPTGVQDLVVDDNNGWIYLADIANPGLIAVNIDSGKARRFGQHPSLNAEPTATMVIDGKAVNFQGKPAAVAVDPISISADKETLFFGAMNGRSWYSMPAKLFRNGASDEDIAGAIKRVGDKPISDGAVTDVHGNHFFTKIPPSTASTC